MQVDDSLIQQQAQNWLVKLDTGPLSSTEEEQFVTWLSQSETHGEAFAEAERTWALMHHTSSSQVTPALPTKKWPKVFALAAALILSVVTALMWPQLWLWSQADFYTQVGERKQVTLADGSVISLNTDSYIAIAYSDQQRQILLLDGELHAQVAKDPHRPFVVVAGELTVTALGTAFVVHNDNNGTPEVTVTEHSVTAASTIQPDTTVVVEEGESVTLVEDKQIFTNKKDVDKRVANAWIKGRFIFKQETLGNVINELGRHIDAKIIIRDDKTSELVISGVLDLEAPLDSLKAMSQSLPFSVTTLTPYVVIIDKD